MTSLAALPNFLAYLGVSIVLLGIFLYIYTHLTPHDEFALIHRGNMAAAISLAGAALGFALPLASVIAHAVSLADLAVWSGVAMLVQLVAFYLISMVLRGASAAIERAEMAPAVLLAMGSVLFGLLNAACLTY